MSSLVQSWLSLVLTHTELVWPDRDRAGARPDNLIMQMLSNQETATHSLLGNNGRRGTKNTGGSQTLPTCKWRGPPPPVRPPCLGTL